MPDYRRFRIPGGTYFFTVNLLERKQDLLVRISMNCAKRCGLPGGNGRFISMPGWCYPTICTRYGHCRRGMTILPTAGRASRSALYSDCRAPKDARKCGSPKASAVFDSGDSGNMRFVTILIMPATWIMCTGIR